MELYNELSKEFMVDYDETGSIGKRYCREDEIGTPFCITFDFNTVGTETDEADHCVTIRERDSMQQVRIPISGVKGLYRREDQVLMPTPDVSTSKKPALSRFFDGISTALSISILPLWL